MLSTRLASISLVRSAMLATVLFAPSPVLAALSSADATALAKDLETISGGWNQAAVDESNLILIKQEYSSVDWSNFFAGYFSSHPVTDDLRNYLVYPTFFWFDKTVHLKLQTALSQVLWQRITDLTATSMTQLADDVSVRNTMLQSHRFLNYFTVSSALPIEAQEQMYQSYKTYVTQYPEYFSRSYAPTGSPYLGSLRVQVVVNFVDLMPLTETRRSEVATALNLSGQKLQLWNGLSVLIIDNDGLDANQLSAIAAIYQATPSKLFHLRFLSVFDFLRAKSDSSDVIFPIVTSSAINNIFGARVGRSAGNQFPPDVAPFSSDDFSIVVEHELNHVVDGRAIEMDSTLKSRRDSLISQAGVVDLQYLRSQIGGEYFQKYPQEFFASIANEYMANSKHTLELALQRYTSGVAGAKYTEPLNQFLFFADVYAAGGGSTFFYTLDAKGVLSRKEVPLTRDSNGHITSLLVDGSRYGFESDAVGNVTAITSLPSPAITSPSKLLSGSVGQSYALTLAAAGGTAPYTWALVSGALPGGLLLTSSGSFTGSPTSAGAFTFVIRATDSVGATVTQTFSLTVITVGSLSRFGALSHIAVGGGWATTITLANSSSVPVAARLFFRADDGTALSLRLASTQEGISQAVAATNLDRVIGANATLLIEIGAQSTATTAGWVEVLTSAPLGGYAIFRSTPQSGSPSEGTVPLQNQFPSSMTLPYDNSAGFVMGAALANLSSLSTNITATTWDDSGNQLGTQTITIAGNGHTAFVLPSQLPSTSGRRGMVQFRSTANLGIAGLGLRFSPFGTFTSVPMILAQ